MSRERNNAFAAFFTLAVWLTVMGILIWNIYTQFNENVNNFHIEFNTLEEIINGSP